MWAYWEAGLTYKWKIQNLPTVGAFFWVPQFEVSTKTPCFSAELLLFDKAGPPLVHSDHWVPVWTKVGSHWLLWNLATSNVQTMATQTLVQCVFSLPQILLSTAFTLNYINNVIGLTRCRYLKFVGLASTLASHLCIRESEQTGATRRVVGGAVRPPNIRWRCRGTFHTHTCSDVIFCAVIVHNSMFC